MSYLSGLREDWEVVPFSKIVASSEYGLSLATDPSGNAPILKMNSISDGRVLFDDLDHVTCTADEQRDYSLKRGDILFNRTNSFDLVGKTAVVREDSSTVFASYLVRFRVRKTVDPRFVGYWFNTSRAQSRLKQLATPGVSQSNINPTSLRRDLALPLPPLPEQQKIADILGTWDEALEKLDALIAAKERRKRGLIQQLLAGNRRVNGATGKWQWERLDSVCEQIERKAPVGIERVLSITAGTGFQDQREKFSRVIAGRNLENYVHIKRGEFSYNKGNSGQYPQGCVYRLEEFDEGAVPNVWISFAIKDPRLIGDYIKHFFLAGGHNHQLSRLINYGVRNDGLLNLTAKSFFSIKVPVPPLEEQRELGRFFELLAKELRLLRDQRAAVDQQKRGLMQKLLTGKVRVSV